MIAHTHRATCTPDSAWGSAVAQNASARRVQLRRQVQGGKGKGEGRHSEGLGKCSGTAGVVAKGTPSWAVATAEGSPPSAAVAPAADVVLFSNGPGEVATWVRPVLAALLLEQRRIEQGEGTLKGAPPPFRISVLLAPCPHASGAEARLVQSFEGVDRCMAPAEFLRLLLLGQSPPGWDWSPKGVCVFLGGDQAFTLAIARRLGYRSVLYAEDWPRWPRFADFYALRCPSLLKGIPVALQTPDRCQVVGDLFLEAAGGPQPGTPGVHSHQPQPRGDELGARGESQAEGGETLTVGLLPGSKAAKLAMGVPFVLTCAAHLQKRMGDRPVRFILPLAPTASLDEIRSYASPASNPVIHRLGWLGGTLELCSQGSPAPSGRDPDTSSPGDAAGTPHLEESGTIPGQGDLRDAAGMPQGHSRQKPQSPGPIALLRADAGGAWEDKKGTYEGEGKGEREGEGRGLGACCEVWDVFPPYSLLRACSLCVTTIGTNTAELGALGVPMIVVLPTHSLEAFRGAAGGVPGLLSSLIPGAVGDALTRMVNSALLRSAKFVSWPNMWVGREVVPELVGKVEPWDAAAVAQEWLESPEALQRVRGDLLTAAAAYARRGREPTAQPSTRDSDRERDREAPSNQSSRDSDREKGRVRDRQPWEPPPQSSGDSGASVGKVRGHKNPSAEQTGGNRKRESGPSAEPGRDPGGEESGSVLGALGDAQYRDSPGGLVEEQSSRPRELDSREDGSRGTVVHQLAHRVREEGQRGEGSQEKPAQLIAQQTVRLLLQT